MTSSGDLVLGFNAHIQRDLPFVLYDLYKQGRPVSYEDHTRINEFLQKVSFLGELAQKFDPTIERFESVHSTSLRRAPCVLVNPSSTPVSSKNTRFSS